MTITKTYRGSGATAIPFNGTPEQVEKNYETHSFNSEARCDQCDCRPGGIWSAWPCENADRIEERFFDGSDGSNLVQTWAIVNGREIFIAEYKIER